MAEVKYGMCSPELESEKLPLVNVALGRRTREVNFAQNQEKIDKRCILLAVYTNNQD